MDDKLRLKRIKRTLSYQGSIMKIYTDDMQMPDGNVVKWDYFDHKGGAAVVPVLADGRILMVRQYRNALDRFTLEIPAGAFDADTEDAAICAARELEEETGYRAERLIPLIHMNSMPAFTNEMVSIYAAENLVRTQQKLDEQEFLEVEAYPLQELIDLIYEGKMTDSKTVCALLAYQLYQLKHS